MIVKKLICLITLLILNGCKYNFTSKSNDFKDMITPRVYTLTFKFAVSYFEEIKDESY